MRERRADPAAAEVRVHGRVAAVVAAVLGVRHQAVAVEDADGRGRDVEAGPGPVADDVGLLDRDLTDVGELGAAITSKTARASSSWSGRCVRPAGMSTRPHPTTERQTGPLHFRSGPVVYG